MAEHSQNYFNNHDYDAFGTPVAITEKGSGRTKLIPCPSCQSTNLGVYKFSNSAWFVRCWSCFRQGPESWDVPEAERMWNAGLVGKKGIYD